MPTRDWYRTYPGISFATPDPQPSGAAFMFNLAEGPEHVDSVLVRQILDLHCYMQVQADGGVSIPPNWWDYITIKVGVGVDTQGSTTPLHLAGTTDRRITGTGFMVAKHGEPLARQTGWEEARFDLVAPIDTHGMRKSPTAGVKPVGNLTAQISGAAQTFQQNVQWYMEFQGFWRLLWETP